MKRFFQLSVSWLPIGAIILGLLIKLLLISRGFEFLLTNLIPDDGFYYFQIARNIVHGLGSTFDGINPTNGYHPLWMVLILPIFKWLSVGGVSDLMPIYGTLVLSAFLDTLAGVVVWRIISRYTKSAMVQSGVLLLWFLNPFNLYESLSGLETSLSVLMIGLLVLFAVRIKESPSKKNLILSGIIGGLMMLSRLDTLFYFVVFLFWLLFREEMRKGLRQAIGVGLIATVVVSPWLVWNVTGFGSLLTSSSAAFTMYQHELIVQDHGPSVAQKIKAVAYSSYNEFENVLRQTAAPELFLLSIGAACALLAASRKKIFLGNAPELVLFGGFILHFILHGAIRWGARNWYFIPFNFFAALFVAKMWPEIRSVMPHARKASFGLVIIALGFYGVAWSKNLKDREIAQKEMYAASVWGNEHLPDGSTIGVFNAGVQAYFSRHRVINLDGLVNNAAYHAMRERHLWDYIDASRIAYLADFDIYMTYRYKSFLGIPDPYDRLSLLKNISITPHGRSKEGINIWQVALPSLPNGGDLSM